MKIYWYTLFISSIWVANSKRLLTVDVINLCNVSADPINIKSEANSCRLYFIGHPHKLVGALNDDDKVILYFKDDVIYLAMQNSMKMKVMLFQTDLSCVLSDILLFDSKMWNAMLPQINSSIQIIIHAIAVQHWDSCAWLIPFWCAITGTTKRKIDFKVVDYIYWTPPQMS